MTRAAPAVEPAIQAVRATSPPVVRPRSLRFSRPLLEFRLPLPLGIEFPPDRELGLRQDAVRLRLNGCGSSD